MQLDNKKIKHREEREKKKENKAGLPYIQLGDAQKKGSDGDCCELAAVMGSCTNPYSMEFG